MLVASQRRKGQAAPPLLSEAQSAGLRTLDDAATQILLRVRTWVRGRAYYAYWLDLRGEFRLRSCLTPRGRRRVAPDYSGLVLEAGPTLPIVPLSVAAERAPVWPRVRDTGNCRWLDLPLGREMLVVILLPPPGSLPTNQLDRLIAASRACAPQTQALYRRFRAAGEAAAGRDGSEPCRD